VSEDEGSDLLYWKLVFFIVAVSALALTWGKLEQTILAMWPCGHPVQRGEMSIQAFKVGLHGRLSLRCNALGRDELRMDSKGSLSEVKGARWTWQMNRC